MVMVSWAVYPPVKIKMFVFCSGTIVFRAMIYTGKDV